MKISTLKIFVVMLMSCNIYAQSSVGLNSYWGSAGKTNSLLNSFEANPSSFSTIKDWGLSVSYGGEFAKTTNSNLYLISVTKRLSNHFFTLRYTPGLQKEFLFNTTQSLVIDSSIQSLNSKYTYKELFGIGYSYKFTNSFSAGFTLRYFSQNFFQETFTPVFSDTLYLERNNQSENVNFWKSDLGINYFPLKNLSLSLSSINLLNFGQDSFSDEYKDFEIRKDKALMLGISYFPADVLGINILYETSGSFQTGLNSIYNMFGGNFGTAVSVFHDNSQKPVIAGFTSSLTYFTKLFGITLSGIKYFSNRKGSHSFSDFQNNGINNIYNNRYSFDKAILTISFTLNTISEKEIEILDLKITKDIFPTLSDNYLDTPFAYVKVKNLTNKTVTVKPESKIEGVNLDNIQSPFVKILPNDTATIPFYTIIKEDYSKEKAGISYADFYLTTINNEPSSQLQLPILVNGINSWDGKVINLRYFIKKDYNFSMNFAKKILSQHKNLLDTMAYSLANFYKTKIIFNSVIKNLVYISDPRASAEYVQFPHETINLKGGDCDDLSVCISSLLESVGIQTALVDYKPATGIRHVNILVNLGLSPQQAGLITNNDNKYFIRKNENGLDEIWIPIETTSLTNFNTAWEIGADKFNHDAITQLGIAKGTVEIIDVY